MIDDWKRITKYYRIRLGLTGYRHIQKVHDVNLWAVVNLIEKYRRFVEPSLVIDAFKMYDGTDGRKWKNIKDVFHENQLNSKVVLINMINESYLNFNRIQIVGGWCGQIYLLIKRYGYFENQLNMATSDIDREFGYIARLWGANAFEADMFNLVYKPDDLVINSSCEHIDLPAWSAILPKGTYVAAATCDMKFSTHINVCEGLPHFLDQLNLSTYFAKAVLEYHDGPKETTFNRYFALGIK